MKKLSTKERFLQKVFFNQDTWCWQWLGSCLESGYGIFCFDKKTEIAHRISYQLFNGPISKGLEINHLCRYRQCVNPEHLEAVTHSQNMRHVHKTGSGKRHRTNFCKNGLHELIGDNLEPDALKRGYRKCKACQINTTKYRQQKYLESRKFEQMRNIDFSDEFTSLDLEKFIEESEYKLGEKTFEAAVKLKAFSNGMNVYSPNVVNALKYLDRALDKKQIPFEKILVHYGLAIAKTRLRKKLDGVLLEEPKSIENKVNTNEKVEG